MDELTVAKTAFTFLLDRYVQDIVPDEAMANYLRLMINQRMSKKTEEPKATAAPAPTLPAVKQIETGSIEAEATRHIHESLKQKKPIDRDYLQRLTGLPFRQVQALINAAISERHNIPSTEKPIIEKVDLSDKRKQPRSEEAKEKMRQSALARYAKKREATQ